MALLVQRLLPLLAVLLPMVLAAGLPFPTTSQHLSPRPWENGTIPTTTFSTSGAMYGMTVGEEVDVVLKDAWECLRESKAHLRQTRSAEANNPTPTLPSPDTPLDTAQHMSDDEFAAELVLIAWELIWRHNQQQCSSTEAATLPPFPPSLPLASPRPMPPLPRSDAQHDAVPKDMSDEDFMAEIVKMVWEFMWRGSQAYQKRIRRTTVNSIPASTRSKPASQRIALTSPTPDIPSGMPFKELAAEIKTLWKCLRSKSQALRHVHGRQARGAEADSTVDAIAELRQVLQLLRNLPKKKFIMEIFKHVKGSEDANNLDATIAGVNDALEEVDRHLRYKRHQEEPQARNRAKRAFTNSRNVDIALLSGMLVMSVIVVIIGNLDPVTQTY